MQKNLALIAKYLKKIYKPTNNNLKTSSNSRNKNVDTTPRYKNDNQSGQFKNQRTVNVVGARENVGSPVVQQSGIKCFNCKEFRHFAKECRKPKRLADMDKEIDEQELEAHYSYMAKIQEVPIADTRIDSEPLEQVQNEAGYNMFANDLQHSEKSESISNTCLVETDDSNVIPDLPDMCEDSIQNDQNDVESDDECVALANLIANLKLREVENQTSFVVCGGLLIYVAKVCQMCQDSTSRSKGERVCMEIYPASLSRGLEARTYQAGGVVHGVSRLQIKLNSIMPGLQEDTFILAILQATMSNENPISTIVIIIAMQTEALPLVNSFQLKEEDAAHSLFPKGTPWVRYYGNYKGLNVNIIWPGKDAVLGVDSVGTVSASLVTYASIQALHPDLIINAGTAGGFKAKGAGIGDVYVASEVAFHDRRIPIPVFDLYGVGLRCGCSTPNLVKELDFKVGKLSTGDSLDMTPHDEASILANDAVIKDMEGAAVAYVADLLKVPAIFVKAVTDIVDGDKPTSEEFLHNLSAVTVALGKSVTQVVDYISGKSISEL
uniref:5'-methylthioadenosine/S-adenosylhomocysteine nucleosidase 2-like n=1 Tax=Tanacetum cinerariifolium TaxID=118510 RepID=A0A699H3L0_TANCI|nr:5'-methylthioadenosine/S-adenosylhomocysteine nucleosidase 2-like [Tanacetum cinerariifolium]